MKDGCVVYVYPLTDGGTLLTWLLFEQKNVFLPVEPIEPLLPEIPTGGGTEVPIKLSSNGFWPKIIVSKRWV